MSKKKTAKKTPKLSEKSVVEHQVLSQCSIEVSRNAKGAHQYSFKVYGNDVSKLLEDCLDLKDKLEKRIPFLGQ